MSSNPPRHLPKVAPGICPFCRGDVQAASTLIFGDVTCPVCSARLWMVRTSKRTEVMTQDESHRLQERMVGFVSEQLGIEPAQVSGDWAALSELGADSLDTLELVIEIEEELDQWSPRGSS